MKDRFKKFVKENETALVVTGGAVAYGLFLFAIYKYVDGFNVKSADYATTDRDVKVILVHLKNGLTIPLEKRPDV